MLPIIDVSEHNGILNWKVIKPQIAGAIIRCGFGGNLESQDDKYYFRNADECTNLNIPFGVYLYSYASNKEEAINEAKHVLRLVKNYNLDLPIYIDLENNEFVRDVTAQQYQEIATGFCETIENIGGFVGIYSNVYYWETKLFMINDYTRWVASWGDSINYAKSYALWQYTSDGKIEGSSLRTDLNRYFGDFLNMAGKQNYFKDKLNQNLTYKLGDNVRFNALFESSVSVQPITNILINEGVITKVLPDRRNPYLINNGTGWVNDSVIIKEVSMLQVGDSVKVKKGAKDFYNNPLAPFVYNTIYRIIQINGNRIVIGIDNQVTAAIERNNLYKV